MSPHFYKWRILIQFFRQRVYLSPLLKRNCCRENFPIIGKYLLNRCDIKTIASAGFLILAANINYIDEVRAMLIDMDITIAYKCISCGTFDFISINFFELSMQNSVASKCTCEEAGIRLFQSVKNQYILIVPCIGCGLDHAYKFNREDIFNKDITIYTCPTTGLKQCFIGRDNVVREYVDNFEKELDIIIDGLGYDRYFTNTRVMIDTLNKLHDLAEQNNLHCECGGEDITVTLLKNGVYLKCSKCTGRIFIPASTNNDLKVILRKKSITLNEKKSKSAILR